MLQLSTVSKSYGGNVHALHAVSLTIPGGLFGLLGPNGAGKSTLMRTIATLQAPDTGTITFDGIDVLRDKRALRRVLGYLPQEFGAYPHTSAEAMLDTWFQVAVFPESERDVEELEPLYLEHHRLTSGTQRITVRVAERPGAVGVDPYHLMIDRRRDDNVLGLAAAR